MMAKNRLAAVPTTRLKLAEQRIQRILIELEEDTGRRIDRVEVDTRNFAQLRVEITLDAVPE